MGITPTSYAINSTDIDMNQKAVIDLSLGGAAVATPMWLAQATSIGELVLIGGGIVLVGLRIWMAVRELGK